MRYRGLVFISEMGIDKLVERLLSLRDFEKKSENQKQKLIEYWKQWKTKPTVPIVDASDLDEEERREFLIKDNVGFGEWDNDMLANEWDIDELDDWGLEFIAPFTGNVDEFFKDSEEKDKKAKSATCPHCGETFDL